MEAEVNTCIEEEKVTGRHTLTKEYKKSVVKRYGVNMRFKFCFLKGCNVRQSDLSRAMIVDLVLVAVFLTS